MNLRDMYQRTTCACRECVKCCKRQPGPLAPGDLEQIASYLGQTVANVLGSFWASPGAVVKNTETQQVRFGCAYADTHMPEQEWQRRAQTFYLMVERDADYQKQRGELDLATSWKPVGPLGNG